MLELAKLEAVSLDLDKVTLYWEIKDTVEDHLFFSFSVQRSESISGPWDTLIEGLKDVWLFSDVTLPRRRSLRTVYYRLIITEDSSQESAYSEPVSVAAPSDLVGTEISMRLSLLLREFTGRKVILYPVRTFGTRCPHCWDPIRYRVQSDYCPSCFGSGYAGGYMRPIETLMQINRASPTVEAQSKYGTIEDRLALGLTWNIPQLKPRDVVIEKENSRWLIKAVEVSEKLRSAVSQRATMTEIASNDVLYKLEVPIDPKEFQASPAREFVRSTDISYTGERPLNIGNMLKVWGVKGQQ